MDMQDITIGKWYVIHDGEGRFAAEVRQKRNDYVLVMDQEGRLILVDPKDVVSPAEIINEH